MDDVSGISPHALLAEAGAVRRLAQALVRRADLADDVAQDALLAALRQPHAPDHLRGWLAAVTRRLAGKAQQARRRRERHEAAAASAAEGDGGERTAERLAMHRRLTDAVAALPEPYRTAVTLRFFDDLPPRAIAQRLGVASDVVRKRLQRGLAMLRERLDGEFGDRAGWLRAFAVFELGGNGGPWLLLGVIAMKKFAAVAAALLVAGVVLWWPRSTSLPTPVAEVAEAVPQPATGGLQVDAPDAAPERTVASPAATPSPADRVCRVTLVDARSQPVADAAVHCWATGDEGAVWRVTDAAGRCAFPDAEGAGGLLVEAEGHALLVEPCAERAGQHRIVLPDGASVAGTLTVDGQPGVGWLLRIEPGERLVGVPAALRVDCALRGHQVRCGRSGEFRLVGLEPDWHGAVQLPEALWLADGEPGRSSVELPGPEGALTLRATQLPTVAGRVVWRDTGEPVAWPTVEAVADFVDGDNSPLTGILSQRDGTFVAGFMTSHRGRYGNWRDPAHRPALREVRIVATAGEGAARAAVRLEAARLASHGEVRIELDRPTVTCFLCIDAAGAPIAGARVAAKSLSGPSDHNGCGTFYGTAAEVQLVGSPRHRIGPVMPRGEAAGTAADPLVFELAPTNRVTLRLVDGSGRAGSGAVLVRCEQRLLAGGRRFAKIDRQLHPLAISGEIVSGRTQADGAARDDQHRFQVAVPAGGATLWSLEPGRAVTVAVADAFDRDLARQTFVVPPFGEELAVELVVPADQPAFRGRVVDEAGQPLAEVTATFELEVGDHTRMARIVTADDGTFALARPGDLAGVRLSLQRDGFCEATFSDLAQRMPLTDFVLPRGREVTIHVVDERGEALDEVPPVCRRGEQRLGRREWLAAGIHRVRDLPPGTVRVACRIGGDEFGVDHDTRVPEVTLRVPRPGKVRLTCAAAWPNGEDARDSLVAVATCREGGHAAVRIHVGGRDDPALQSLLPGTWQFALVASNNGRDGAPPRDLPLGFAAVVAVHAGETVTATLR